MKTVITAIYADGGVIGASRSALGGMYAWCHVDASGYRVATGSGLILPRELGLATITNNVTEFLALLLAMEALPEGWNGTVYSDSWITLQRFFLGARLNGIPNPLIARLRQIHQRMLVAHLRYMLLDGHPTRAQLAAGVGKRGHPVSKYNVWCDRVCKRIGKDYVNRRRLEGAAA